MARDEDQPQQVVADVVVERASRSAPLSRCDLELAGEFLVLALERACRGGAGRWRGAWRSPSARRPGCPGRPTRPLLERRDQRVLRQLLGHADVAHDARQAGDEPRRLDAPDRLDRAVGRLRGSTSTASIWLRKPLPAPSRSSGVRFSPKSSASNSGRSSSTPSAPVGFGSAWPTRWPSSISRAPGADPRGRLLRLRQPDRAVDDLVARPRSRPPWTWRWGGVPLGQDAALTGSSLS